MWLCGGARSWGTGQRPHRSGMEDLCSSRAPAPTTSGARRAAVWSCWTGANSEPGEVNGGTGCARFEYGLGQADRMRTLYAAYLAAGGPGRVADVET